MNAAEPAEHEPLLVTVPAAQKITGSGRSTVYRWLGDGKLVGVKAGTRLLITMESIKALVASLPAAKIRKAAR